MSYSASQERRHLILQSGAELELFEANAGYRTGIEMATALAAEDRRIFLPRQFENPLNAAAALRLACEGGPDYTVATLLCDRAERYFSTRRFHPDEADGGEQA